MCAECTHKVSENTSAGRSEDFFGKGTLRKSPRTYHFCWRDRPCPHHHEIPPGSKKREVYLGSWIGSRLDVILSSASQIHIQVGTWSHAIYSKRRNCRSGFPRAIISPSGLVHRFSMIILGRTAKITSVKDLTAWASVSGDHAQVSSAGRGCEVIKDVFVVFATSCAWYILLSHCDGLKSECQAQHFSEILFRGRYVQSNYSYSVLYATLFAKCDQGSHGADNNSRFSRIARALSRLERLAKRAYQYKVLDLPTAVAKTATHGRQISSHMQNATPSVHDALIQVRDG